MSSSRRLIFYLLVLALILFVLRPRASWENLRALYEQRRWVVTTLAVIIIVYFILGIWEVWRAGYLWPWGS